MESLYEGDIVKEDKLDQIAKKDIERRFQQKFIDFIVNLLKWIVLIGVAYIILAPLISMFASSFFTAADVYNPSVFLIPLEGTINNYVTSLLRLDYWTTLGKTVFYTSSITVIQVFITSMVGYGFARFKFPFKNVLFACVILTIVIPTHTIMIPLYMLFRNFDPANLFSTFGGEPQNWLGSTKPIYLLTLFGSGLRSGLFIYIFNQFFRGLPKEIEEAAFIDGASTLYTYLRIMLPNALPSIVTVSVFSMVWQYNDTFYAKLFAVSSDSLMSMRISTLRSTVGFLDEVRDPLVQQVYLYAGIVLTLIPILLFYVLLQRQFIEGIERSGVVG
ncbi:carbohydrate ABC transporter permease [Fundicoccus sp. Sow4_H7]|uniref:carbohydrate ABC transporter permease n=1 Tax=Fundicoccus sp. Sow4_H7 TaxID=3438784 RepID=UPI003F913287